ncbi:MAG: shikimate kinase [Actinomycetota bacterium]|nr:shikimate kinase [Actinomycetota bacterium]
MSIVLVGMMGAGKTTVGRATANQLGWAFIDSDAQVEARTGRTVAQIWAAEGEDGFRRLEAEALDAALASTKERPAVVAAAGGVVLDPRNRALLEQHPPVVWLRARLETLARRVGEGTGRPLLAADPPAALERLMAVRYPLYEQVADSVVDVDELAPAEIVERVLEAAGR